VDLGGNIYRIDFETVSSTAISNWGMYKLAALNGTGTRKFFYAPDVVLTKTFAAVQVGSGDREKPLLGTTTDAFFTVFDDRVGKGTVTSFTAITPSNLGLVGSTSTMANGCYIPMSTAGEKVVNAPLSFRGFTYFGTNRPTPPAANTCSANLGEAKTYAVPLFCRAPTSDVLKGGGLPPSPVAGFVTFEYEQTIDGKTTTIKKQKDFLIGAPNPKHSAIDAGNTNATLNVPRKRRYWFQENAR
jgi:type IV pilus assembly protein PilY1